MERRKNLPIRAATVREPCGVRFLTVAALTLLLTTAVGCDSSRPLDEPEPERPREALSEDFDPVESATLEGQVTWEGDLPVVDPFRARVFLPLGAEARVEKLQQENPNRPTIDGRTRGVGNAVVFLRGVDPKQAKPWDQPPVVIDLRDLQIHVRQGDTDSHYGFIKRGAAFTMTSSQPFFHSLRAGGAAFFTLAFPDPNRPTTRRLRQTGLVELSSGAGYYWMRAYLFVDDHPYYARTDASGRFALRQVPSGRYEVVCWMPQWRNAGHERDPESGLITRWTFQPPVEAVQNVTLSRGEARTLNFTLPRRLLEGDDETTPAVRENLPHMEK
jgi:hypothetical protein